MAKTRKPTKPRKPRFPRGPHDAFAVAVIEELGGTKAVAKIFGIKEPSVSDWKRTGIPHPRMMYLEVAYAAVLRKVRKQNGDAIKSMAASDDVQNPVGVTDRTSGGGSNRKTK